MLSARTKLVSSSTSSLQIYVHYDGEHLPRDRRRLMLAGDIEDAILCLSTGQDPRYDDWQDASPEVHIVQKDAKKKGTGGKDQESSASASAAKRGKKRPLHAVRLTFSFLNTHFWLLTRQCYLLQSPAREGEHTTPLAARRVNLVYFGWHEINVSFSYQLLCSHAEIKA